MPRVKRRAKRYSSYTERERRVLLTGVPLTPKSTRFGHPIRGGWNVEEIVAAWSALRGELLVWWQSPEFDRHRRQHDRPFAERFLEGQP